MDVGISQPQRQVLDFIESYIERNRFSPSYKEIAEGTGRSVSGVWRLIHNLIERGYLRHDSKFYRSLQVIRYEG